jgi:hypothetical protein
MLPAVFGCTHPLTVDNFPSAAAVASTTTPRLFVVGLVNQTGAALSDEYIAAVATALPEQPVVSQVVYPYVKGSAADVVAYLEVNPEYKGAGSNFWVNFPGFLVWAPAWNGYKYYANPHTQVRLTSATGAPLGETSWDYEYQFHQADMGRTWTEISWLEAGIIALVGGAVFTRYDQDQSAPFAQAVSQNYGRMVASTIGQALAKLEPAQFKPADAPPR